MMKDFFQKTFVFLAAFSIFGSAVFLNAPQARAQVTVIPGAPFPTFATAPIPTVTTADMPRIAEEVLRRLALIAARTVVQSMMLSIIDWANNGFEGSPAFVVNIELHLRQLSDYVANSFIDELGIRGYINSPFRDVLLRELQEGYRRQTARDAFYSRSRYALDQYSDDPQAFLRGDFARGGIRAWIQAWVNPANNPYGALGQARQELDERIALAREERRVQLDLSRGVLSWCGNSAPANPNQPTDLSPRVAGCKPGETVRTPGILIHERIQRSMNMDLDLLATADEIDAVIGAVMNGLIRKTLMEVGFFNQTTTPSGGFGSTFPGGQTDQETAGTASTYANQARTQLSLIERYRSAWQRLQAAANNARAICSQEGNPVLLSEADQVFARAEREIARANELITELLPILQNLTETQFPAQMRVGIADFQTFASSGRMLSASDISTIEFEASNSGEVDPPTLLVRMNRIIESSCQL